MSYNRKITEYALLPNGAFPLDARSHFKSFAQANQAISGNVTTVENSSNTMQAENALFGSLVSR